LDEASLSTIAHVALARAELTRPVDPERLIHRLWGVGCVHEIAVEGSDPQPFVYAVGGRWRVDLPTSLRGRARRRALARACAFILLAERDEDTTRTGALAVLLLSSPLLVRLRSVGRTAAA